MKIQNSKCVANASIVQVIFTRLLKSFFDEVNHDLLLARVRRKVKDKRMLKLIRAYLNSGVMVGGVTQSTDKGTPQGGPASPLLSNIMLDDLDKELEKRGHCFCRYADDCAPRMLNSKEKKREMQCYKTDEGRPFGICLQKPVPNRPRLRWLNGQGGERRGKRLGKEPSQVTDKKMNASEPLITCRKRRDDIKTMESRCHGTSLGETCLRPKEFRINKLNS